MLFAAAIWQDYMRIDFKRARDKSFRRDAFNFNFVNFRGNDIARARV